MNIAMDKEWLYFHNTVQLVKTATNISFRLEFTSLKKKKKDINYGVI